MSTLTEWRAMYFDNPLVDKPDGVFWNGTHREAVRLQVAIDKTCRESEMPCAWDWINDDCGAHGILSDQRALDGLLRARRMHRHLRAAEMTI